MLQQDNLILNVKAFTQMKKAKPQGLAMRLNGRKLQSVWIERDDGEILWRNS
jgi:hypothetical protein